MVNEIEKGSPKQIGKFDTCNIGVHFIFNMSLKLGTPNVGEDAASDVTLRVKLLKI